jgi:thiamine-monophosphate kinase
VSDGLSLDAARLAAESGCGLELHLDQIPIRAAAVALAERDQGGPQPLDRALGDGEDFELLLAVPPEAARQLLADQPLDVPLTCLGQFVARAGIQARWPDGSCRPLVPRGWLH